MADSNLRQTHDPPSYHPPAYESNELPPPPNYVESACDVQIALNSGSRSARPERFSKKSKFTDVWATVLFGLQLSGFIYLSYNSITAVVNPRGDIKAHKGKSAPLVVSPAFAVALSVSALVGFCLSLVYFVLVEKFTSIAIHATYLASITFSFAFAAYALSVVDHGCANFVIVVGVISLMCWVVWRSRIPFATVMLEAIIGIRRKYKGMFYATILASILQILYAGFVVVTFQGIIYMMHDNPKDCLKKYNEKGDELVVCPNAGRRAGLIIYAVFSYYWVHQVIKTIVRVTVSGVFGAYYFLEGTAEGVPTSPTISSAKRAFTTSFGSICFGSLVLAPIRSIRALSKGLVFETERFRLRFGLPIPCSFFGPMATDLVDWIETIIMQRINQYAYAQMAIYGKDYCTAAKDTWPSLRNRGIIKDALLCNVLTAAAFCVGGVTELLSFLYVSTTDLSLQEVDVIRVFAFYIGYSTTMLFGEIIDSGTATTFVVLVEDFQALERAEPVLSGQICQTYPCEVFAHLMTDLVLVPEPAPILVCTCCHNTVDVT